MKAKTELQKQMIEFSNQLPTISEKQKNWSSANVFDKWGVISRGKINCLECSHVWINTNKDNFKKTQCPNCKSKIKMFGENKKAFKEMEYFAVLTTIKGFQVVRMVSSEKYMVKGENPVYFHSEVMQHWINEKGEVATLSKSVMGFSQCYDRWIHSSELTLKESSQRGSLRFGLNPWKVFPDKKVLPVIKRNGFKGSVHDLAPHILFTSILTDNVAETLLKTKQINTLQHYVASHSQDVSKYWHIVKICMRNNYVIKDYKDYKDYIELLEYFGKDLHSSKYVCPVDLNKAHDKLVAKKRDITRKLNFEALRQQIAKSQKKYTKQKQAFFGLKFTDKNITVKVIENVREFMEEGDEHGHCVFTNEYYKRADSLVLSASIKGVKLETVEVSLTEMAIKQSRGKKNKATKYNQKIIDLVNKNLHKINAIYKHAS